MAHIRTMMAIHPHYKLPFSPLSSFKKHMKGSNCIMQLMSVVLSLKFVRNILMYNAFYQKMPLSWPFCVKISSTLNYAAPPFFWLFISPEPLRKWRTNLSFIDKNFLHPFDSRGICFQNGKTPISGLYCCNR